MLNLRDLQTIQTRERWIVYDDKRVQRTNSSVLRLGIDSQQTSLLQKYSNNFTTFVVSRVHKNATVLRGGFRVKVPKKQKAEAKMQKV